VSQAKFAAVGDSSTTTQAALLAALTRQQSCHDAELLHKKLDTVDLCVRVYHKTIDAKQADLTVREAADVTACRELDLYPPSYR
jgi:hypothetical protein